MPTNIILYARKSSESEDRQVLSIDSQIQELRIFASKQNLNIVKEFKESRSAKAPGRPYFNEMLKMLRFGKAQGILCWKLDRLARNPVDGGAIIWALDQDSIKEIHTPNRTFRKSGDDAFWMNLEFGMAKKYVDDLSDNVKRGQRAKAANGQPPSPWLPVGYIRDQHTKDVVPDPDRFPLVQRIWKEILKEHYRPMEVLHLANRVWGLRMPVRRSLGGGVLSVQQFYKLLKNPFYKGVFSFGGEVYTGSYKPMVTPDEFQRVQMILGRKGKSKPKNKVFAYRGLLSCGSCGRKLTAEEKMNRFGTHYVYYHCARTIQAKISCKQPYLEERKIEEQAEQWLEKLILPKRVHQTLSEYWLDAMDDDKTIEDSIQKENRKKLDAVKSELKVLRQMKLKKQLDDEEYEEERKHLLIERNSREISLQNQEEDERVIEPLSRFVSFLQLAKDEFHDGDIFTKRDILRTVGSNLLVKDRNLHISAKKPFQLIVERPSTISMRAWGEHVRKQTIAALRSGELADIPDLTQRKSPD